MEIYCQHCAYNKVLADTTEMTYPFTTTTTETIKCSNCGGPETRPVVFVDIANNIYKPELMKVR